MTVGSTMLVMPRDGEVVELGHPVGDALLGVPVRLAVVLEDLGAQHEDVLVHERRAEVGGVDRAGDGGTCAMARNSRIQGTRAARPGW